MKKYFFCFVLLAPFVFSDCKSPKQTIVQETPKAPVPVENTYWRLIELNGKTIEPVAEGRKERHLILKPEQKTVVGFAGCNSFHGSYSLQGPGRLSFTGVAATLMACLDGMEEEQIFLGAINKTDSYFLSEDTLSLFRARMAPLAKFKAVAGK